MKDTGWRELVESGWNMLVSKDLIYQAVVAVNDKSKYTQDIYGDGMATDKIVDILRKTIR